MAPTTERPVGRTTTGIDTRMQAGGVWLAIGSLLLVVGLALHPPPPPDPGEFMGTIAGDSARWVAAHVASALAFSMFAVAGLVVLTAESRFTRTWWTVSAWAVLVVGALWVTLAAVVEATVITQAAVADDAVTFDSWSGFAEAPSAAFGFFALAVAAIAGNEALGARSEGWSARGTTPAWASWVGVVAGILAVAGFVLGLGLGFALGGVVWVASTIVMGLWTLWFGVALARSDDAALTRPEESDPGKPEVVP